MRTFFMWHAPLLLLISEKYPVDPSVCAILHVKEPMSSMFLLNIIYVMLYNNQDAAMRSRNRAAQQR